MPARLPVPMTANVGLFWAATGRPMITEAQTSVRTIAVLFMMRLQLMLVQVSCGGLP